MKYDFTCGEHYQEVEASIKDGPPEEVVCDRCGENMHRIYSMPATHYLAGGFYNTDYTNDTSTGDKLTQLNNNWSRMAGEKPPKPAADVPKNLKEKY